MTTKATTNKFSPKARERAARMACPDAFCQAARPCLAMN
jgi:hypothetical protein